MPTISITVTANDWTRIKPALRSAYGPALDPESQLSDSELAKQAVRRHVQQIVKDYERTQAEAAISVPDLD
ncbi:MAG: hypothetical protein ACE5JL_04400 [Dehalococcoidia bacterium]